MRWLIKICLPVVFALSAVSASPTNMREPYHGDFFGGIPPSNKIVGGRDAQPGEFPYQLRLQVSGMHVCGASFIRDSTTEQDFALTAAHCIIRYTAINSTEEMTVTAGSLSSREDDMHKQVLQVTKIVRHPKFNLITYESDIAVLFLSESFRRNDYVKPIRLPNKANDKYQGHVSVTGWGRTSAIYPGFPDHLKVVKLPLVDNVECAEMYAARDGNRTVIFPTNICAGFKNGGKDSCQGDSGGPLAIKDSHADAVLLGITSWGNECAKPNFPGVYLRVSSYVPWIISTVRENPK